MAPEFAAYQNSPHSKVECVELPCSARCERLDRQQGKRDPSAYRDDMNSSPRPIPSALESNRLVPARETCENCHWPQKFGGVTLRVINKYAEDETNTRTQTVLMMMIGGNKFAGIHGAHLGPGIHIRFSIADAKRQGIPWIEYRNTNPG